MNVLNETPSAVDAPPTNSSGDSSPATDPRIALIQQFQREALTRKNLLSANTAAVNGDLMVLAYGLGRVVEKKLAQASGSADSQLPALATTYLDVTRQIGRFTRLDLELQAADASAPVR
jgi:hypothetical protein